MCLSYCHRLGEALFWNHLNCHPRDCEFAGNLFPREWRCATCRHQKVNGEERRCGLTGASLPEQGGCCHYNVTLVSGCVVAGQLIGRPWRTSLPDLLAWLEVPYQERPGAKVELDLNDLEHGIPATYGIGTEPEEEEEDDPLGQAALSAEDEQGVITDFDLEAIFP